MLAIYYGADSFSRHEALAGLRAQLDSDGMLATNTTTLDARNLTLTDVTMVCDAIPFLGAWRLVHVRGLLARAGSERTAGGGGRRRARATAATTAPEGAAGWLELAGYVSRMPPTTVLILEDAEVRDTNPLLAALQAAAVEPPAIVRSFGRMDARALQSWLAERLRQRGVAIEPRALELLARSMPVEPADDGQWHALWSLTADIEKLSLYAGETRITERDVERLVPAALESRLWVLADRVTAGNQGEALAVLEELLAAGRQAPVLLATVANRFRQLLVVRELTERRAPAAEVRERSGVRTDYQLQQLQRVARRWSLEQLEARYLRIVAADRDIKTGRTDEVTAVELLVAELTQAH